MSLHRNCPRHLLLHPLHPIQSQSPCPISQTPGNRKQKSQCSRVKAPQKGQACASYTKVFCRHCNKLYLPQEVHRSKGVTSKQHGRYAKLQVRSMLLPFDAHDVLQRYLLRCWLAACHSAILYRQKTGLLHLKIG